MSNEITLYVKILYNILYYFQSKYIPVCVCVYKSVQMSFIYSFFALQTCFSVVCVIHKLCESF